MNSPINSGTGTISSTPKNYRKFYWPEARGDGSPKLCGVLDKPEVFGWDDSPEPLKLDPMATAMCAKKRLDPAVSPRSSHPRPRPVKPVRSSPAVIEDLSAINELAQRVMSRHNCSSSSDLEPLLQDDLAETLIACTQQIESKASSIAQPTRRPLTPVNVPTKTSNSVANSCAVRSAPTSAACKSLELSNSYKVSVRNSVIGTSTNVSTAALSLGIKSSATYSATIPSDYKQLVPSKSCRAPFGDSANVTSTAGSDSAIKSSAFPCATSSAICKPLEPCSSFSMNSNSNKGVPRVSSAASLSIPQSEPIKRVQAQDNAFSVLSSSDDSSSSSPSTIDLRDTTSSSNSSKHSPAVVYVSTANVSASTNSSSFSPAKSGLQLPCRLPLPDRTYDKLLKSFREEEDEWMSQLVFAGDSKSTPGKQKGVFFKSRSDNRLDSPGRGSYLRRTSSFHQPDTAEPQPLKKQKSFHNVEPTRVGQCSDEEMQQKRLEALFRRKQREIEAKKLEAQKRRMEREKVRKTVNR